MCCYCQQGRTRRVLVVCTRRVFAIASRECTRRVFAIASRGVPHVCCSVYPTCVCYHQQGCTHCMSMLLPAENVPDVCLLLPTGVYPTCECEAGWMGRECELPCVNGTAQEDFTCQCDACFSGPGCDKLCDNHGVCNNATCTCDSGWWGESQSL